MKAGVFHSKPTRREVQPGSRVLPSSSTGADLLSSYGAGSGRLASSSGGGGRARSSTLGGGGGSGGGRMPDFTSNTRTEAAISRARTLGLKRAPRTSSPEYSSPERGRNRSPSPPRVTSGGREPRARAQSYSRPSSRAGGRGRDHSPSPSPPRRAASRAPSPRRSARRSSSRYPSEGESEGSRSDDGRHSRHARDKSRSRADSRPPPRPASRAQSHARQRSSPPPTATATTQPPPQAQAAAPPPVADRPATLFGSLWTKASQVISSATGATPEGGTPVKEAGPSRQDSLQRTRELGVPEGKITPFQADEDESGSDGGHKKQAEEDDEEELKKEQSTLANTRPIPRPSATDPSASLVSATLLAGSTSAPTSSPFPPQRSQTAPARSVEPITYHRAPPLHPRDHTLALPPRRSQYSSSAAQTPFDWLEPIDKSPLDAFLFHRDPRRAATRKVKTRTAGLQRPPMPLGRATDPGPVPPGGMYHSPAAAQPGFGGADPRFYAHQEQQQQLQREHQALALAQFQQQQRAYEQQLAVYQQQVAAAQAQAQAASAQAQAQAQAHAFSSHPSPPPPHFAPTSIAPTAAPISAAAFYSPAMASVLTSSMNTSGSPAFVASPPALTVPQPLWPVLAMTPAPASALPPAAATPTPAEQLPASPPPQPPIPPTSPRLPTASIPSSFPLPPIPPTSPPPAPPFAPLPIRSPPIPPASPMPPNMQHLLATLMQEQAIGVPLPPSPAPPAMMGRTGVVRQASLRVDPSALAGAGALSVPGIGGGVEAGIVLTPPTPIEPRSGVELGGGLGGEGGAEQRSLAPSREVDVEEDEEEEEEEEEPQQSLSLPPLELEWPLPDLGIGLGFAGGDGEAPRSALIAPESFFSSLGLGKAGLEMEKVTVAGERGGKGTEVGASKEEERLPFPVQRVFVEEEEDEDDEDDDQGEPSLEEAFAATANFVSNFTEAQVPPPVDSNHHSRMQKWLDQQGVVPSGMGEVLSLPVPPVMAVRDRKDRYDEEAGSVDSIEQNVGRDEITPLPPQPPKPPSSGAIYRPRTAPPAALSTPAPSAIPRFSLSNTSTTPLSLPTPPPPPPSFSYRRPTIPTPSSPPDEFGPPSPTGASFDIEPVVAPMARSRVVPATSGPSLVFGGSVVGEAMPQRPTPPQPPKSPRPALPTIPSSSPPSLPAPGHPKTASNAEALAKLSNSAFSEGASTGPADKKAGREEPDSPRVEIDSIFANW